MSILRLPMLLITTIILWSVPTMAQIDSRTAADSLGKALAADSIPWKLRMSTGLGLTSVQLNNWAGGGQDAVTFTGLFIGSADYADGRFSWDNDLDIGYGLTKLGSESFRKADDRIIFGSKASIKQNDILRYTAYVDFRTQFANGYAYDKRDPNDSTQFLKISNLFAPAYLTGALGAEWTPLPQFRLLVAPISARAIFVLDDDLNRIGAFGVDSGKTTKVDVGAILNATLDWELVTNVRWKSRLNAFMRYEAVDLWVVTVENAIVMKVNDFINVSLLTDLFYDDRVPVVRDDGTTGPALQMRNVLSVNFVYNLQNF
ncbi:MAG TPA: hypothetical protein DIS79_02010 [Bacteroidetes bacterium]|nr:hypothetical protein [Bacteroidota bacterium]HRK03481.1 DUF3078 domain-containing protein [Chlorobiota bacterium]